MDLWYFTFAAMTTLFAVAYASKLKITPVFIPGFCERKTKNGDLITIHYSGILEDGFIFHSSYDKGVPFVFQLGAGQVIKGWDQGLLDMCEDEKRNLTIPSHLAYGYKGYKDLVPGGATLIYHVELLKIHNKKLKPNIFKDIDKDEDRVITKDEMRSYLKNNMVTSSRILYEIFHRDDKDRNGYITWDEFLGPKHDEL